MLHRSAYGRHLLASGRDEEAARFSGIDTRRVLTVTYVIAWLLTGVSGMMVALYTNSVSPSNHTNSYELYAIATAALGDCSLRGSGGIISGTVVLLGIMADQMLQRRAAGKLAS